MSKKEEAEYEEYESLKNSKFKQQKLPGWRPVPSMVRTIIIYFGLGIVFVGLGVLILLFSNKIVEDKKEYCANIPANTNIWLSRFKSAMKKFTSLISSTILSIMMSPPDVLCAESPDVCICVLSLFLLLP